MSVSKIVDASDAVAAIHDGDVLATSGYGGHGVPEELLVALAERFSAEGSPRDLTLVHAAGQGDGADRGLNHLGLEGLLRRVVGGHFGLVPKIARLAVEEKIEAYNFPEGVIVHLYRNIAAGAPGLLSTIGLGTFVDPRIEGGKVNAAAVDDLVELVDRDGQEWLLYRGFPIDVAFVRGTTADRVGNVTMEREALSLEALTLAIAAKTSGGHVICQVERIAEAGSLDSRAVRLPGILVDAVVVARPENHMQTFGTLYDPAVSGELRIPLGDAAASPPDARAVIARRAALELRADAVVNIGLGLPDRIGAVAAEERIQDLVTFMVDPGVIGGVPLGGYEFGAAINREAVMDHASAFDFIDGGGLDTVFLGVAECDAGGNVNVSRFGDRLAGCGGVINLTQRTPNIVFLTTFTGGGLRVQVSEDGVEVEREGTIRKFVTEVEQITFSGRRAIEEGQRVTYVTERCVFRLDGSGLLLTEVAPGIDVERDVLSHLPFAPAVDGPSPMRPELFRPGRMGLREWMLDVRIDDRLSYDPSSNTVFMDFSGMHVRTRADVDRIVEAVDTLLGPLGHRVNSIVNYDRFVIDEDAVDAYADAVQYVSDRYYLNVSRHSTSAFLRLKLGKELTKRRVAPSLYATAEEARTKLSDNTD